MSIYKSDRGREVMRGWYDTFLAALRHPHTSTFVDTDVGRTHVLSAGPEDAPPLLCFHGVMGSAPSALSLVEGLVPHFRIVFPDTPGQPGRSAETRLPMRGDAYGRWATQVMDGVGLDTARVLGVSMGGYVATKLAAAEPGRIAALGLWVPGGLVASTGWKAARLGWASLTNYLFPSDARMKRLFDEIFTDHDDRWFAFYRDGMQNVAADRTMPENATGGAFDGLRAPVYLVAHEGDAIFPADALVARARALFPNLQHAEVVPGWRHVPPFAPGETDAVLDALTRFLLEAPEPSTDAGGARGRDPAAPAPARPA